MLPLSQGIGGDTPTPMAHMARAQTQGGSELAAFPTVAQAQRSHSSDMGGVRAGSVPVPSPAPAPNVPPSS